MLSILTDFAWTICTTELAMKQLDQAFKGIWCSDSKTAVNDLQLGNMKVPCPVPVNCTHRKEERKIKTNNGQSKKKERQMEVCVFLKTLWRMKHFKFWDVCSE